jgi:hypothetical protein
MTGKAINPKSEALELHELSSEALDAVSGGDKAQQAQMENKKQAEALKAFQQALQQI